MRALYRIRQGLANLLGAPMRSEDRALAARHLSTAEWELFARMEPADQRHSVRVLRTLIESGVADEELLAAALLHDVGKSRCRISVLHRTVAVLLEALFGELPPFALQKRSGWWMPIFVLANHPRLGACMLTQAGSTERVWRLVELHQQDPRLVRWLPDSQWLREALIALRRADNVN
ncbi:MAG: HD domain-containing protein [Chloroflexota bacterium]